ncbi:MAG: TatD family hydrolase [Anaerolineae bacterium]|nr:TatD family hydrolase [Anaerolineae bacterium]
MAFPLIDIGINLMHRSFSADRDQVMKRAQEAGVGIMIITGTSERGSRECAQFARKFPGVLYSTAGVHPHDAKHCTPNTIRTLQTLTRQSTVVAVGECGLDFNRDFSPRPVQEQWFEAQIELAGQVKKPLFMHERDAHQRFIEILKQHQGQYDRAVVHCFTGSIYEAKRYLDMGLHIGITGWICDDRRGKHLREVVRQIPLDRLMLETDAPFLTPRTMPARPKDGRNEPAFLPYVLKAVSQAVGKPEQEIAEATTRTARLFFGLDS